MASERRIGLAGATALVVANMVGTGVFTTSGLLIAELGSAWLVLLVWVLGGLIALSGALCYGALARHIPESGGEYVFLSRTLHPALGYLAGWVSLLVGFAVPLGAVAYAFGQYLTALNGMEAVSPRVSGTVVIVVAAGVHAVSLTAGARTQAIAVAIELVAITLFTGFGMGQLTSSGLHNVETPGHLAGLGVGLVVVAYSYQGWNAAIYVGGEVADPKKNLPRALVLGTAIVTALYLGLNAVFVLGTPSACLDPWWARLGQAGFGGDCLFVDDLRFGAGDGRAPGDGAHGSRRVFAARAGHAAGTPPAGGTPGPDRDRPGGLVDLDLFKPPYLRRVHPELGRRRHRGGVGMATVQAGAGFGGSGLAVVASPVCVFRGGRDGLHFGRAAPGKFGGFGHPGVGVLGLCAAKKASQPST
jgi:hypothetical protein